MTEPIEQLSDEVSRFYRERLVQPMPEPLEDAFELTHAEGYQRGYDVAEARAISRLRLGLPLERGAERDADALA